MGKLSFLESSETAMEACPTHQTCSGSSKGPKVTRRQAHERAEVMQPVKDKAHASAGWVRKGCEESRLGASLGVKV